MAELKLKTPDEITDTAIMPEYQPCYQAASGKPQ